MADNWRPSSSENDGMGFLAGCAALLVLPAAAWFAWMWLSFFPPLLLLLQAALYGFVAVPVALVVLRRQLRPVVLRAVAAAWLLVLAAVAGFWGPIQGWLNQPFARP